jgi:hypothetical protein
MIMLELVREKKENHKSVGNEERGKREREKGRRRDRETGRNIERRERRKREIVSVSKMEVKRERREIKRYC